MISTICLNPVLERIQTIHKLRLGDKNFCDSVAEVPSGFGITAARVIRRLGEGVVLYTLLGQMPGHLIRQKLRAEGITFRYIETEAASRLAATVFETATQRSTMVAIDPSPQVTLNELTLFEQMLSKDLVESNLVLIGGSLPRGVPHEAYAKLVKKFKAVGKRVLLDTRGPALGSSTVDLPYMLKLDLEEAREYTGRRLQNRNEIRALGSHLYKKGAGIVALTLGRAGVIVICSKGSALAVPPRVKAINSYGSGDAFVAGFAVGLINGESMDECIRLATACGVANALTILPGYIDLGDVTSLCHQVEVRWLVDSFPH